EDDLRLLFWYRLCENATRWRRQSREGFASVGALSRILPGFAGKALALFDGHRQLADQPCDLVEMPRIGLGDDTRQPLQALFIAQRRPIVGNDRRRAPAAIDWDD